MAGHSHNDAHTDGHDHGTMSTLMTGFVLAVILTVIPFAIVMGMDFGMSRDAKVAVIMLLGAVQVIVHLRFFLHVGKGAEEGWTMASTVFAVVILVIVLAGSLWVMHNMNVNMMPDHQMEGLDPGLMLAPPMPEGAMQHH